MNIKCILIDDEPFALELLEDDLLSTADIKVIGKFLNAIDAKHFLSSNEVDLIFCDIQMPGQLGTQFVKSLANPPLVIFTTAYHQYAVEGFELNAIDYLLKPIRKERLMQAVEKVKSQMTLRSQLEKQDDEEYVIVNSEYKKVKIHFSEITYVEGLKDYVKIHLLNRAYPLLTRSNLKNFGLKLPEDQFVRIHNSYIVNKSKIESYSQTMVCISGSEIPIGKHYADITFDL